MIGRVTQNTIVRVMTAQTARLQSDLVKAQAKVSSQKKLQTASDDPVGTALVGAFRAETRRLESYLAGIGFGRAVLGAEDATLDQVHSLVVRAKEIAVTFANGVHDGAARGTAAEEVEQIERALVNLANTSVAGRYIFAGLERGTVPFLSFDDPGFDPQNVSAYSGPTSPFSIQTGAAQLVRLTTPGNQVFDQVLAEVDRLREALTLNDVATVTTTIDTLDTAAEGIRQERASVGGRAASLNTRDADIRDAIVIARTRQSEIEDADISEVLIELVQLQNALEVTLTAGQALLNTTILDFVRL